MEIGARIKVVKNLEGNLCEPFIGMTGTVALPFSRGCRKDGWVGVILDMTTMYGNKFNFHVDELEEGHPELEHSRLTKH